MSIVAGQDELEPPWAKYPWIEHGSIGWRMGSGESYQMVWGAQVDERYRDVASAVLYLKGHPPAPRSWTAWVTSWLAELGGGDDEARLTRLVEREGLVGDDVAYPVFIRNAMRDGGMVAPWLMRGAQDPDDAVRYSARELGWWARWFHGEGDRAAWLAAQPPAPDGWAGIAAQIAAETCAATWATLDGGAARLIPIMAAHGELLPPWRGGHSPKPEIDWDEATADDRDRWSWWVFSTFEDAKTWNAYLVRHAAPPAWQASFEFDF